MTNEENEDLVSLRKEYESSIVKQREAFKAQSGEGNRAELATIAAEATRIANDNRRKYENAVYENSKKSDDNTFSIYHILQGETMEEYSGRTGIPVGALDWSYWTGEDND